MLRHSSDNEPGYSRKKQGRSWAYFDEHGKRVTDRDEIDRLNAIALPPAYTDAWFCKDANGHLQATGVDARGRKQYRYHPTSGPSATSRNMTVPGVRRGAAQAPRRVDADLKKRKLEPRRRSRGRRSPARHGAYARRQRAICAREQELRRDNAANAPRSSARAAS